MPELKKISKFIYEIPQEKEMNVPVRIFASESILENIKKDKTLEQANESLLKEHKILIIKEHADTYFVS